MLWRPRSLVYVLEITRFLARSLLRRPPRSPLLPAATLFVGQLRLDFTSELTGGSIPNQRGWLVRTKTTSCLVVVIDAKGILTATSTSCGNGLVITDLSVYLMAVGALETPAPPPTQSPAPPRATWVHADDWG